jgi:hypothetical protein
MNNQQDLFPDPEIKDAIKRKLIIDIMNCKKVSNPLPGMVCIEMGPPEIIKAIEKLEEYLNSDTTDSLNIDEIIDWLYTKYPAIACELDQETAEIGESIRKMNEALVSVLV